MLAAAADKTFKQGNAIRLLSKVSVYGIAKDSEMDRACFLEMEINFDKCTTEIYQSAQWVSIDTAFNYGLNKLML